MPGTVGRLAKFISSAVGGVQQLGDAIPVGWADIQDNFTSGTPITVPANTWTVLTNNAGGAQTSYTNLPDGVTNALWGANQFNFSQLTVGDMVEIRFDATITTTGVNQEVEADLFCAIGGVNPFQLPFITKQVVKSAGTVRVLRYNGLYIGSNDMRNFPAQFKLRSDANCTAIVNGWWVKITRR